MFTFEPGTAIWSLISFGIVLFIVARFVYPPLRDAVDKRRAQIARDLEQAEADRAAASRIARELEDKIASIREEERRMLDEAKQRADELYSQYERRMYDEVRALRQHKEAELARAEQSFFKHAEERLARLVVLSTEKVLRNDLTPEQQRAVVADRIRELERLKEF